MKCLESPMGHLSFLMQLAPSNSTTSSKSLIPTMICNRFPIPICLHLSWHGRGFLNTIKGCQWTTIVNFNMPIKSRSNNENYTNHQHYVSITWGIMTPCAPTTIASTIQGIMSIPTHVFMTCVQINHFCDYQCNHPTWHHGKNNL